MPRQKYEQIYSILKGQIEAGDYPVGGLLPSENVLIGEFQCSRNTVRRALANLVRDGYVQTRQGWGVCNIYQPIETSAYTMGTIESFAETARRTGQNSATRVVLFTTCTADEALSRRTGFPPGTELFYLQRVHDLDGVLTEFDSIIGLRRLKAIHLNDSKNPPGSRKDRHACLGEGTIGLEALGRIVRHPALKDLPFCLETPNDLPGYAREIALMREMAEA